MNEQLQAKLLQVGAAHRMAACSTLAREASKERWVVGWISRIFPRTRNYLSVLSCSRIYPLWTDAIVRGVSPKPRAACRVGAHVWDGSCVALRTVL